MSPGWAVGPPSAGLGISSRIHGRSMPSVKTASPLGDNEGTEDRESRGVEGMVLRIPDSKGLVTSCFDSLEEDAV